jgi:porin
LLSRPGFAVERHIVRRLMQFRVDDPPLLIGEAQYNQQKTSPWLPGTVKVGAWYHAGPFNDERFASDGLSQADPPCLVHAGRSQDELRRLFGIPADAAGIADKGSPRGIGVFARVSGSPGDRNPISFY